MQKIQEQKCQNFKDKITVIDFPPCLRCQYDGMALFFSLSLNFDVLFTMGFFLHLFWFLEILHWNIIYFACEFLVPFKFCVQGSCLGDLILVSAL